MCVCVVSAELPGCIYLFFSIRVNQHTFLMLLPGLFALTRMHVLFVISPKYSDVSILQCIVIPFEMCLKKNFMRRPINVTVVWCLWRQHACSWHACFVPATTIQTVPTGGHSIRLARLLLNPRWQFGSDLSSAVISSAAVSPDPRWPRSVENRSCRFLRQMPVVSEIWFFFFYSEIGGNPQAYARCCM